MSISTAVKSLGRKLFGPKITPRQIGGDSQAKDFLNAKVDDSTALCLSGGGNRAVAFHLGATFRLNELGLLTRIDKIFGVSAGAVVGGVIVSAWPRLKFDGRVATNLVEEVAAPLLRFARAAVDVKAMFRKDGIATALDRYLFHGAPLSSLPDSPQLSLMSNELLTGREVRITKDCLTIKDVARVDAPIMRLSRAVAASAAFPGFLSAFMDLSGQQSIMLPGADPENSFTGKLHLIDGGLCDNRGGLTASRECRNIWISDAGSALSRALRPGGRFFGQYRRAVEMGQSQINEAHEIILTGLDAIGQRKVAMWKIDAPVAGYAVADSLPLTREESRAASAIRTRFDSFSTMELDMLMRAGYAGADASLRARGIAKNSPVADFATLPRASAILGLDRPDSRVFRRSVENRVGVMPGQHVNP